MVPEHNTLLKILLAAGAGSRRELADHIKNGRVRVNGTIIDNFKHTVDPDKDKIAVAGHVIDLKPQPKLVVMLNKPAGIITTTSDEKGRKTVVDILPHKYQNKGLYPAGRLDKDSTGLILLTNDGRITYQLTHPKFEHEKEYMVRVQGKLSFKDKEQLQKGLQLEDGITYPAQLKEIKSNSLFNYSITIHEGRKRQIRRMFEALGHNVLALKRVRIGKLFLGGLAEGEVREIPASEIQDLFSIKI